MLDKNKSDNNKRIYDLIVFSLFLKEETIYIIIYILSKPKTYNC